MGLFDAKKGAMSEQPEIAEFDRQLTALAQQKRDAIAGIGQMFVDNNTADTVTGTPYEESFQQLALMEEQRVLLEKRKLAAQGMRKCEDCGNILVLDSAFCNKCGTKLAPLFAETKSGQKLCPKCGHEVAADEVFCSACGCRIAAEN